jgi:hypothetical protein
MNFQIVDVEAVDDGAGPLLDVLIEPIEGIELEVSGGASLKAHLRIAHDVAVECDVGEFPVFSTP